MIARLLPVFHSINCGRRGVAPTFEKASTNLVSKNLRRGSRKQRPQEEMLKMKIDPGMCMKTNGRVTQWPIISRTYCP